MLFHVRLDTVRICHITQGENSLAVNSRKRRTHRRCPRRKQQFVISLRIHLTVRSTDRYLTRCRINGSHFRMRTYIDVKPLAESFRSLHEQTVALGNHSPQVIRQTAVGIRDVSPFLKKNDFCLLCVSTNSGCCSSSTGYPSNDKHLHNLSVLYSLILFFLTDNFFKYYFPLENTAKKYLFCRKIKFPMENIPVLSFIKEFHCLFRQSHRFRQIQTESN